MGGYFCRTIATILFWFGLCIGAFAQVAPIPDNAAFSSAISACLREVGARVTGECTSYGTSSGYGTMPNWDTSRVTSMTSAFYAQASFNGDISGWDTSNVTDMRAMFFQAYDFNQDISSWDTGRVVDMFGMFHSTRAFNQNIGLWDTSQVTNMSYMFYNTLSFNSDIGSWNTSQVTTMQGMFAGATAFYQNIRMWNVTSTTDFSVMFLRAAKMFQDPYNAPETPSAAWFNAPDTTAPTLASATPSDDAADVSISDNIVLTFSENVAAGTGNIVISDGASTHVRSQLATLKSRLLPIPSPSIPLPISTTALVTTSK